MKNAHAAVAMQRMTEGEGKPIPQITDGLIDGPKGRDAVPLWGEKDEYVLPKEAVEALGGADALDELVERLTGEKPGGKLVDRDNSVFMDGSAMQAQAVDDDPLNRMLGFNRGGSVGNDQDRAAQPANEQRPQPAEPPKRGLRGAINSLRNRGQQVDSAVDRAARGYNKGGSIKPKGYNNGGRIHPSIPERPGTHKPAAASLPVGSGFLRGAVNALTGRHDRLREEESRAMGAQQPSAQDRMVRGFNAGGSVGDERRPRTLTGRVEQDRLERTGSQSLYAHRGSFFDQSFPNTKTAIQGAGQNIREAYSEGGVGAAAGATARNTMVPAIGFGHDLWNSVNTAARDVIKPVIDVPAQALKTAVTGDATPIDQPKAAEARMANLPDVPGNVFSRADSDSRKAFSEAEAKKGETPSPLNPDVGPVSPSDVQKDAAADAQFRGDMRGGIEKNMRGPYKKEEGEQTDPLFPRQGPVSDPRDSMLERGNAGLKALSSDEGLRDQMNEQYKRDNLGVQASVDANGRMVFSDAPKDPSRPTMHRNITSGFDMAAGNRNYAEANEIRARMAGTHPDQVRERRENMRADNTRRLIEQRINMQREQMDRNEFFGRSNRGAMAAMTGLQSQLEGHMNREDSAGARDDARRDRDAQREFDRPAQQAQTRGLDLANNQAEMLADLQSRAMGGDGQAAAMLQMLRGGTERPSNRYKMESMQVGTDDLGQPIMQSVVFDQTSGQYRAVNPDSGAQPQITAEQIKETAARRGMTEAQIRQLLEANGVQLPA